MARRDQALELAALVGAHFEMEDAADGWPALARVSTEDGPVHVAIYIGPITLSHRERDDVERRFQNPGSDRPIEPPTGRVPLLLGIWTEDPHEAVPNAVVMSADVDHRVGRPTRFSVFSPIEALREATASGWATAYSATGESLVFFNPVLLPLIVQAAAQGVEVGQLNLGPVIEAAGLSDALGDDAAEATAGERARRSASVPVRDAAFGRRVADAYGGRCALCGLDLKLVEGAHIHPVAAEGSTDVVQNGVCLCRNHHRLFDSHRLWIDPASRSVRIHPDVLEAAASDEAAARLVESTAGVLAEPTDPTCRPTDEVFALRYASFSEKYHWAEP